MFFVEFVGTNLNYLDYLDPNQSSQRPYQQTQRTPRVHWLKLKLKVDIEDPQNLYLDNFNINQPFNLQQLPKSKLAKGKKRIQPNQTTTCHCLESKETWTLFQTLPDCSPPPSPSNHHVSRYFGVRLKGIRNGQKHLFEVATDEWASQSTLKTATHLQAIKT